MWLCAGAEASSAVAEKFRELIGGADAKVLLVPTAMADSEMNPELNASAAKDLGLRNYDLFNTHDRTQADSEEFAARIRVPAGFGSAGEGPVASPKRISARGHIANSNHSTNRAA
jgi:hypothetical protein